MKRFRFQAIRNTLAAITVAGGMILTAAAPAAPPAAATPWRKARGDYDGQQKWHDANRWMQNQQDWVIVHRPELPEKYFGTHDRRIGDSDRLDAWHYGDGGFDRRSIAAPMNAAKNETGTERVASSKPDASVEIAPSIPSNI